MISINDNNTNLINNQVSTSILIIGSDSKFIWEFCKLLLSTNINIIYIYDNQYINKSDIESLFNNEILIKYTTLYKHNQNITIILNYDICEIINISDYCNKINSKLIIGFTNNANCAVFVDSNKNHIVYDINGYNIESVNISQITDDGIVHCTHYDNHNYTTNDTIYFDYIEGTNLNQFKKDWKISVINNKSFKLNDFNCIDFKIKNAIIMNRKNIEKINHNTFNSQLNKLDEIDLDEYSKKLIESYLTTDYEKKIIHTSICIITSIIILELNKLLSGVYKPINQWLTWYDRHLNDLILSIDYDINNLSNNITNFIIFDYDTFGYSILNILSNICNTGNIIIKSHNKLKILNILNKFKIKSQNIIIDEITNLSNMDTYSNYIIITTSTDIIIQKNIHNYCLTNNIPLFDYKMNNNIINIQSVIPDITDIYSWEYIEKKSYPDCILNNFPTNIHHLILWSLSNFEIYSNISKTLNKWIDNDKYLLSLNNNEKKHDLKIITNMTIIYNISEYNDKNININIAVIFAIDNFIKYYYSNIKELLESFPEDHEIEPNVLFWSKGKICPHPIKYDYNCDYHNNYILLTIYIILDIYNIKYDIEINDIISYIIIYCNTIDYNNIKINELLSSNPVNYSKKYNIKVFDKYNTLHINWLIESCKIRGSNYMINCNSIYNYIKYDIDIKHLIELPLGTLITSLLSCEIIKYLSNYNNYTTTNIDLINSKISNIDTNKVLITIINNNEINIWKKNIYTLNSTLNEFKIYYEKIFNVSIIMIVNESTLLYAEFMEDKLYKTIDNILLDKTKNIFTILSDSNIELPNITIVI